MYDLCDVVAAVTATASTAVYFFLLLCSRNELSIWFRLFHRLWFPTTDKIVILINAYGFSLFYKLATHTNTWLFWLKMLKNAQQIKSNECKQFCKHRILSIKNKCLKILLHLYLVGLLSSLNFSLCFKSM